MHTCILPQNMYTVFWLQIIFYLHFMYVIQILYNILNKQTTTVSEHVIFQYYVTN